MLDKIIRFSLNNKYIILLCSLLLIIFGVRTASKMDIDVFPDRGGQKTLNPEKLEMFF